MVPKLKLTESLNTSLFRPNIDVIFSTLEKRCKSTIPDDILIEIRSELSEVAGDDWSKVWLSWENGGLSHSSNPDDHTAVKEKSQVIFADPVTTAVTIGKANTYKLPSLIPHIFLGPAGNGYSLWENKKTVQIS